MRVEDVITIQSEMVDKALCDKLRQRSSIDYVKYGIWCPGYGDIPPHSYNDSEKHLIGKRRKCWSCTYYSIWGKPLNEAVKLEDVLENLSGY